MAAPVVASVGTAGALSGSASAPGAPSGVVNTSLVVVFQWAFWATATAPTAAAFNAPNTSWKPGPFFQFADTADGGVIGGQFWYHYASGSESGTYAFSYNTVGGLAPTAGSASSYAARITGGPVSGNPFVDTTRTTSSGPVVTTLSIATFTPNGGNSLLLGAVVLAASPNTVTLPASWTANATDTTDGEFIIASIGQTAPAATGTLTFSWTPTSCSGMVVVATIRPVAPVKSYAVNQSVQRAATR